MSAHVGPELTQELVAMDTQLVQNLSFSYRIPTHSIHPEGVCPFSKAVVTAEKGGVPRLALPQPVDTEDGETFNLSFVSGIKILFWRREIM